MAWLEQHPARPFTGAMREMMLQLPEVPTHASAQQWASAGFEGNYNDMIVGLGLVGRMGDNGGDDEVCPLLSHATLFSVSGSSGSLARFSWRVVAFTRP